MGLVLVDRGGLAVVETYLLWMRPIFVIRADDDDETGGEEDIVKEDRQTSLVSSSYSPIPYCGT